MGLHLILVTNNSKHFQRIPNLKLENLGSLPSSEAVKEPHFLDFRQRKINKLPNLGVLLQPLNPVMSNVEWATAYHPLYHNLSRASCSAPRLNLCLD